MKTFAFSGASDDLIHCDGEPRLDEVNWVRDTTWLAVVATPAGEELGVAVQYTANGVWRVSAEQTDEDHPIPDWPITTRQSPTVPYSAELVIEAPDDARVVFAAQDRDGDVLLRSRSGEDPL